MKIKISGWEEEKRFFDSLGIESDNDSRPELFEWHWTVSEKDAAAAQSLFKQLFFDNLKMSEWPE